MYQSPGAKAWSSRAERVLQQARKAQSPVSVRDALFRAATYFRTAEFYLHTNWDDPRILEFWKKNVDAFTEAISLLPMPGICKALATPHGFEVPIYWFRADGDDNSGVQKRPTLIVHIGFDSGAEETFHSHGRAALERGYNVCISRWTLFLFSLSFGLKDHKIRSFAADTQSPRWFASRDQDRVQFAAGRASPSPTSGIKQSHP